MSIAYDPALPSDGAKPTFPPLLRGVEVGTGVDPFDKAVADATTGRNEAGDLYWTSNDTVLRMAVVLAPEEPTAQARPVLFAAACALNDCIGALAPPEVGLRHRWPNRVVLNGAEGGVLRLSVAEAEADTPPDWLVVGVSLALTLGALEPGSHPDITALSEEGCGHLSPVRLTESWSRHLLVWINRWQDEGPRPVFEAWLARAAGWQEEIVLDLGGTLRRGTFLGLDEAGGLLLQCADGPETLDLESALALAPGWPERSP